MGCSLKRGLTTGLHERTEPEFDARELGVEAYQNCHDQNY